MFCFAIVASHPIQYQSPLWRSIAAHPEIDLTVYYCLEWGTSGKTHKNFFGVEYRWDTPLLEGYRYKFLRNYSPKPAPSLGGFINPGIFWELWKNRYDAVLILGWMDVTFWFAFLAAKLKGTPVFLRTVNSLSYDTSVRRPKFLLFLKKIYLKVLFHRFISCFLAIGTWNRNMYLEYGIPLERIFHFPYAVWNEFFLEESKKWESRRAEVRKEIGVGPNTKLIVYAGRFVREKHPEHAIQAYERIKDIPDVVLLMIGDGAMRKELEKETMEKGLPGVRFLGFRNQTELMKLYAISDVFVRADSPHKGDWGATVNEAMACGLPIICTDTISSQADLVRRGENGFVYKLGDIDALADALRKTLLDEKLLEFMKKKSREIISRWGYKEDVEGLLEALAFCAKKDR